MADIIGSAPEALSNSEIIRLYNSSLTEVTKAATDPVYDYERATNISQAKYQYMLIRGFGNAGVGWGQDDYGNNIPDWVSWGGNNYGQEETGADARVNPNVNILGGDAWKFCAVMGSSSPRVKGVPDDLRNPMDIAAAHCADVNIRDLWTKNKIDRKWKIPAFHQYATGPCFVRGFWNTDPVKYGSTSEPQVEIVTGPDGSPMPKITGYNSYANGDAEVSFHSVFEVSIPWEARELRNNFLRCERMVNRYSLLARYPGKPAYGEPGSIGYRPAEPGPLDEWRDGQVPDDQMTGSTVTASEARQATTNPSGTANTKKQDQWRFVEWWIPPHLYEAIQNPKVRQIVKTQFARGLYIARVGSITVEIDEREVTEEWCVVQVAHEDKICQRSICADNVPLSRVLNDLMGMAVETVLRAITQTICDNQLIDRQAMSTKQAVPAEIILTALPVDGDISKRIFQIPPAHLSDQVLPLLNLTRSLGQDITGIRPELSGGGQPTQTYREALQRKNQALQQLAPQAQAMRDAAEDLAKILVNLRAKYGSGTVKATQRGAYGLETSVVQMADLQSSGWHPESDDSFPQTLSDRRDAITSLLRDGYQPEVLTTVGILDIINAPELCELLSVPGFQSAVVEQIQKSLHDVDKLLQGQPIPPPPAPPGAPPGVPMPSIPIDMFDDHPLVDQFLARWLRGPVGQRHAGTLGFLNVLAFWNQHHILAQPPQPPPEPPIKGTLSMAARVEDFPSSFPGLLKAAGVPAADMPPSAPPPPPAGPPPGIGAPPLAGARPNGAPLPPVAPLSPLPSGPPLATGIPLH